MSDNADRITYFVHEMIAWNAYRMNEAKLNSSLLGKWPNFPQNVNRLIGILKGCGSSQKINGAWKSCAAV